METVVAAVLDGVGGSGPAPISADADDGTRAQQVLSTMAFWRVFTDVEEATKVSPVEAELSLPLKSIVGASSMWRFRGGMDAAGDEDAEVIAGSARPPASEVEDVADVELVEMSAAASLVDTDKVFSFECFDRSAGGILERVNETQQGAPPSPVCSLPTRGMTSSVTVKDDSIVRAGASSGAGSPSKCLNKISTAQYSTVNKPGMTHGHKLCLQTILLITHRSRAAYQRGEGEGSARGTSAGWRAR